MTLKNQIGLEGDVTPPQYMAEVKPYVDYYLSAPVIDWGWLKIERSGHSRYGREKRITLKLPLGRHVTFAPAFDGYAMATRALFLAFGRIECAQAAWHMRGGLTYVDAVELDMARSLQINAQIKRGEQPRDPGPGPYPDPTTVGFTNPTNLANYK